MTEPGSMPDRVERSEGVQLTLEQKRRLRLRNWLVGGAVLGFVAFVYTVTWIKIANKTF